MTDVNHNWHIAETLIELRLKHALERYTPPPAECDQDDTPVFDD